MRNQKVQTSKHNYANYYNAGKQTVTYINVTLVIPKLY